MQCHNINFGLTRREFFGRFALGMGGVALSQLLSSSAQASVATLPASRGLPGFPSCAPRAMRVIYLCISGGPSQMDLFDYNPVLNRMTGQELPASVRMGQRLTTMSVFQS